MRRLQTVVGCAALVLALAPMGAFASSSPSHKQDSVANALAQLQLAQQQATDLATAAQQSAANEREIALLKSQSMRQDQLDNADNAAALQQIAQQLADQIRATGSVNAANELAILQIKAAAIVNHADNQLANALAIGRPDEIANAQAQDAAAHQLADYLTGTLAQQNMSNDTIIADDQATAIDGSMMAEAQNDEALGADELLAADAALNAGDVAAESADLEGSADGAELVAHAEAEVANAEAQAQE